MMPERPDISALLHAPSKPADPILAAQQNFGATVKIDPSRPFVEQASEWHQAGYERGKRDFEDEWTAFRRKVAHLPDELQRQLCRGKIDELNRREVDARAKLTEAERRKNNLEPVLAYLQRLHDSYQWFDALAANAPPRYCERWGGGSHELHVHRLISDIAHESAVPQYLNGLDPDTLRGAHKFSFLGADLRDGFRDLADFGADLLTKDLFALPYADCWFEAYADPVIIGIYAAQRADIEVRGFLFKQATKTWIPLPLFGLRTTELDEPWVEFIRSALLALVTFLASRSAESADIPAPEKLNARRLRNGHEPLSSYRVITVRPVAARSHGDDSGRQCKSPRMHWRRGHLRHLLSGVIIPIAPMLVGAAENGFLAKDYRVTGTAQAGEARRAETQSGSVNEHAVSRSEMRPDHTSSTDPSRKE